MKENNFRNYAKYYDQIYLKMKDYEKEAKVVKDIINQFQKRELKTLFDVGCGTGEHMKHLSSEFQCTGIDINRIMIETAKNKVPNAKFKVGNMVSFRLKERFDVIICLFSGIGYVQDFDSLAKTLQNFHRHLHDKGLVIIEPWVFKKDFKKDHIGFDTYEDANVKLARMGTTKIVGSKWIVFLDYLIGEKGEIRYVRELHQMLALDYEDYIKAFESTQLKNVDFLKKNLWEGCRGLFIATK